MSPGEFDRRNESTSSSDRRWRATPARSERLRRVRVFERVPYRILRSDLSHREVGADVTYCFFPVSGGEVPSLEDAHVALTTVAARSGQDTRLIVVADSVDTIVKDVIDEYLESVFTDQRQLLLFSERVVYEPNVPVSRSPIGAASLSDLAKSASHSGGGAVIGWLAAGAATEPSPILLLTVPIGIIVCGAAAGVARGLGDGLHEWIVARLAGDTMHRRLEGGHDDSSIEQP